MGTRINSHRFDGRRYRDLILVESGLLAYWPLGNLASLIDADLKLGQTPTPNVIWDAAPTPTQIQPTDLGGVTVAGNRFAYVPSASWMQNIQSIELWVKFTTTTQFAFMSRRQSSEHFGLYHNTSPGAGVQLNVAWSSGGNSSAVITNNIINSGNLTHVVATWVWGATFNRKVYLNGVLQSGYPLTEINTGNAASQSSGSDDLRIASETSSSRRMDGVVGHAAVYSNTMSALDVAAHYAAGIL